MSSPQVKIPELLVLLAESQAVLDQATGIEGVARPGDGAIRVASLAELADLLEESQAYLDGKVRVPILQEYPDTEPATLPVEAPEAAAAEETVDPIPEAETTRDAAGAALEKALQQCQAAAETGYQKAIAHVNALGAMAGEIEAQANRLGSAARSEDDAEFKKQIAEIVQTLKDEHSGLRHDIDDKRKNLSTFNITLFGRTMTGKSTLMEILTRGDGSSIGKGAQRTTRDVRAYEWKGLTVTDVPGVAAYGGEDDAQTAHQAANLADLVLFLISDDGPQAAEAAHLARLRQQGKSMLGIFNVKSALNDDMRIERFIRDQDKAFDPTNLSEIRRQFDEMSRQHIPGQELELVNAHLRARYLAGLPENAPKPWRDGLERASRFRDVEERILKEVIANGPFLRTHSFLNIGAAANLQAWESARQAVELAEQTQGRLKGRLDELRSWQTGFKRRANQRIDQLMQQTAGRLRNEIVTFAEQYCEDKDLSNKWNAHVRSAGIDQKCQALQKQLDGECQDYMRQLAADVQQELRLLENQFEKVSMETGSITNSRRRWNWSVTGVSATLGTAAVAALAIPIPVVNVALSVGLGIAAVVTSVVGGIVGRLFGNRDKKRQEAIAKITPELRQNVDGIERQIRGSMTKWLDDFTKQCVNRVEAKFSQLVQSQKNTAGLMRSIADRQRESLLAVNRDTIVSALQHLGEPDAARRVDRVARIPGRAVALSTAGNANLSADAVAGLSSLLQEQVVRVPNRMSASAVGNALKSLDAATSERLVAQLT